MILKKELQNLNFEKGICQIDFQKQIQNLNSENIVFKNDLKKRTSKS
jgi:hypothetical protein